MSSISRPRRPIPKIRGTQIGLRNPKYVDLLKADMLQEKFAYHEPRAQVGGVLDARGVYKRITNYGIAMPNCCACARIHVKK